MTIFIAPYPKALRRFTIKVKSQKYNKQLFHERALDWYWSLIQQARVE